MSNLIHKKAEKNDDTDGKALYKLMKNENQRTSKPSYISQKYLTMI